ncbi:MAG: heme ABC exporter ATP-binding protein CcmA [Chloroflexi bacterium]|nr:heme ABC exporter ATP-binding protein CcmA [Chloroflexota bacterium]
MEASGSRPCAVEARAVTKSFGARSVLRGVDLSVRPGESLVIFGPNGAGKTTLLKILATVMNPTSGAVLVNGRDVRKEPERCRQQIGVVSHQTFLYGNLTGRENLEFYCRMYDVPRAAERVREVAEMVQMSPRLHDRVYTLSRGMQQRLSIARALLHRPPIMLLDEPETGLDQQALGVLWQTLQAGGEGRRTIILTSHSLERGLELGQRLVILFRGRVAYEAACRSLDLTGLRETYQYCTGARK